MEVLLKIKNATPGNIKSKLNKALKRLGTDFHIEKCIKIRKSEKGRKLQGRINFQGLNISIENRKGSIRYGIDSDGHSWKTKMNYPYGRIIGVQRLGHDGDHIDCYVGDNRQSDKVYIIHIKNCVTGKYDEDKIMLGFNNQKEVITAFKTQYDNFSKIFDGIEKMSIYEFKECLKKKTKSIIVKLKDFTHENADYKVIKALAGVGKALNCDFICKSIDKSKCSLEMITDCDGNIVHRWKKITDEYLLNQKHSFSDAIRMFVKQGYTQGTPITILDKTPEILKEKAKMPDVKITVEPKILRKILTKPKTPKAHNHFMPVSLVNDLPIQLTKPLAILKDTENNHVIIVTEQFYKKHPVIAAIEVAKNIGGNIKVNSLRSFHDKRCESFFDFWNKKEVLFEDKKKMEMLREFLHVRGFNSSKNPSKDSIPKPINKSINHAEKPSYQALQDIIDNSNAEVEKIKRQAYNFLCKFLGLPKINKISKSITDELTVNGKIIFDPLYGTPLKQKDFAQMINKLENFLSRRLAETERQMLLQSTALGHLIALSTNGQTQLLLETVKLKNIVHKGKSFEQLCTDYETLKHNFDKVTDNEIAKLQFIEDKIGVYVTSAKDATIKIIKDIYYDAIINHKSKQKISQEMYDQLGFLNRSWDTIARTESNNLKNHAFIVGSLNDKGKTYFRRRVGSYNTCKICASHRDKIALWSEKPLTDDTINDELADIAIWSGKSNIGRNQKDWWIPEGSTHPNCFCEWEKLLDEEVKYFRKSIDIAKAKNPKLSEAMIGNQNARKNKVKHDGEYVLTKNGSKDFGEITKEIGRQPGKIRLRIGIHDENSDKGEGEAHIERPKRLKQLKMHGFDNARDFVEYTCNNYDEVYSSGMALLLVKKDNGFTCVVQLTPLKNDEFYDVKTVYVMPERTIKNKLAKDKIRLIWQKPNSPLSKSLSPYCLKSDNGIPTGFIKGTPDRSSIPKPINKSNKENRITTRRSC